MRFRIVGYADLFISIARNYVSENKTKMLSDITLL